MIGPIVKSDFDILDLITGEDTCLQSLGDALLNRTDVFLGDGSADNLIDKFKSFSRFVGLQNDFDVAILASPTRLPNEFTLGFGSFSNGLSVRDLRLTHVG